MEKTNTKEMILQAALDLFSVSGFEATSISQIAEVVGIRKASLYSHFASKQDILDTLISGLMEQFNAHSIFVNANWEDPDFTRDKTGMTAAAAAGMVKGQIRYILHDPQISKVRKLLTVEQFQNQELSTIFEKQSYADVLRYNTGLMRFLIRDGVLRAEDPEIMAAQFAWPVSMWTNLCDRDPEREEEVMDLIDRHVRQFFAIYQTKEN